MEFDSEEGRDQAITAAAGYGSIQDNQGKFSKFQIITFCCKEQLGEETQDQPAERVTGGGDPAEHEAEEPVANQGLEGVRGVHGGQGGSYRTGTRCGSWPPSLWSRCG